MVAFYVLSAFCLLYYARKICNTIEAWHSLAVSSLSNDGIDKGGGSESLTNGRFALMHSRRLYWAALVLFATCLLRAGSWSAQTFDESLYDNNASPWFYPLCFYQVPQLSVTLTVMCLVANADLRARALGKWCHFELKAALCHQGSDTIELTTSRESIVSPMSDRLRLSVISEHLSESTNDSRHQDTSEVDIAAVYP